jgi:predicted ATP-grasp superfamily ATP-dependent carboligase
MEVIVLDGNQRPTLAITRSLGKRGIRVMVGAETKRSLSSCSRFCAGSFVYPSPYQDPEGFFQAVLERTRRLRQAILLPVTDVTVSEILRRRAEFAEGITIPFDGFDKYSLVSDKAWLVSQCRTLGLPVPRTLLSTDYGDREDVIVAAKDLGFPLVVKPSLSRIRTETGWIGTRVRYARDEGELRDILSSEVLSRVPFILQERIQGPGVGIFLLMKDGVVLARFAHRRLREKPPSGGVSVLSESIEPPAAAMDAATRLLEEVRWSGVAMVEFKIDERGGVHRILEVNARFWGSLELAVSAGVDFPYLLFQMAKGERIGESTGYRVGLKVRWELGDLDHLWIRLSRNSSGQSLPAGSPSRSSVLVNFVADSFRRSVRNEVLRLQDARPFLHELGRYVRDVVAPHPVSNP